MELHSTLGLCDCRVRAFLVSLCLDFFATFLKKGSTKNFPEWESFMVLHTCSAIKSCVFALHPRSKVLVKLFQKLAGLGRAHKNGVFFLPSFFFCASCAKRKSGIMGVSLRNEFFVTFFEKKVTPKNFLKGKFLWNYIVRSGFVIAESELYF